MIKTSVKQKDADASSYVLSYLGLRKAVGILGLVFPFVLLIGAAVIGERVVEPSISHYHHTIMRDVFVGILCAIGVFLLSYRGLKREDDIVGDFACLCAIGVALFPTDMEGVHWTWIGAIHGIFAVLLFSTLAYFSLVLFKKTDSSEKPRSREALRNWIYTICGCVIVAAIVLIGLYGIYLRLLPEGDDGALATYKPVFWLEMIAVLGFAISWLVKGEAILQDL